MIIASYADASHRSDVIALWLTVFGYDSPHNAPALAIDKKLAVRDGLFFVAVSAADQRVIGEARVSMGKRVEVKIG